MKLELDRVITEINNYANNDFDVITKDNYKLAVFYYEGEESQSGFLIEDEDGFGISWEDCGEISRFTSEELHQTTRILMDSTMAYTAKNKQEAYQLELNYILEKECELKNRRKELEGNLSNDNFMIKDDKVVLDDEIIVV